MSLKIIDRNIRTITGNISKLNDLIHSTAVLILSHARDHGDCTRALVLVKAMPASMRRKMLIDWFERNSPIRLNLVNDKVGMLKAEAKGYTAFDVDAAMAVPFYVEQTKTDDGEGKAFDWDKNIVGSVGNLAKRFEKLLAGGNVPEADRASVEAAVATLKALKIERVVPASDPNNLTLTDGSDNRIPGLRVAAA